MFTYPTNPKPNENRFTPAFCYTMQSGKGIAFQVPFQFGEENIQAFEVVYDIGKLLSHVFRKKNNANSQKY